MHTNLKFKVLGLATLITMFVLPVAEASAHVCIR